jgi:hypothetical protein
MLALIASALLGLYIFAPYIFFHRVSSLFIRLKKFQRTETEEIVAGIQAYMAPSPAMFERAWLKCRKRLRGRARLQPCRKSRKKIHAARKAMRRLNRLALCGFRRTIN